jgi:hypothetical protein
LVNEASGRLFRHCALWLEFSRTLDKGIGPCNYKFQDAQAVREQNHIFGPLNPSPGP